MLCSSSRYLGYWFTQPCTTRRHTWGGGQHISKCCCRRFKVSEAGRNERTATLRSITTTILRVIKQWLRGQDRVLQVLSAPIDYEGARLAFESGLPVQGQLRQIWACWMPWLVGRRDGGRFHTVHYLIIFCYHLREVLQRCYRMKLAV